MAEYNGTIELISGITPKNKGNFALVNAKDVAFYETDATGEKKEIRLDKKIQQVGVSDKQKQEIVDKAVEQTLKSDTITSIQTNVTTNANDISTLNSSVKTLQEKVDAFEGDNKDLNITFDSAQGNTLFLHTGDKPNNDQDSEGYNVIASTVITGTGGGTSASYKLLLVQPTDENTNRTILYGNSMSIRYSLELTSLEDPTKLLSDKVNMYLYVEDVLVKTFIETADAGATKTLDISEYLALGYNSIKLTAAYTEILEDSGEKVTTRSTKRWYVNTIQMYLTSTFDDAAVKTADVNFSYTPFGDLEKTIYFKLDDEDFATEVTSLSNRALSKVIPMQTHGSHTFEVYCTGIVEGILIESDHLFYDIMFAEANNNKPIIRAVPKYEALQQYGNNPIEYSLYVADSLMAPIKLESYNVKDGIETLETSTELTIDRAEKVWNYSPQSAGSKKLVLTSGETIKELDITVTDFPYDITPVTSGLALDFNPAGRTNQDKDYNVFDYNGIGWTLSDNFDWVNGGWKTDAEGASYFCVKAGTTATINYKLFNDAYTVAGANNSKGNGKEFKVIFKTTNVAQADTTWLECQKVAATGTNQVGIQMDVHNAYVKSSLDSLTIPYSEEDIIEFDMNIVPMTFNSEGVQDETVKDISMIMTYEDGTPVQPKIISDVNTSFKQLDTEEDPAAFITIGSPYCDVHIYRMKAYSQFLSDSDILSNFYADARSGEEKANRYLRNLIYTKNDKLTPESVADACPDLRVIKVSAPRFTTDKKEKIKDTIIEMIYRNGDPTLDNWIAKNCQHSGQGTSSNEYGSAGRNMDLIMNKSGYEKDNPEIKPVITLGDKVTKTKKITLTRKSVPTNYLNVKVNIASSEHSNNALLQKRYDRYLPYKSPAKVRNEFVKNTMEFFNCVIFIQEADTDLTTHKEFNDTEYHFYAIGNVGDSKKTDSSRTNDPDDKKEFCVEIMDWNGYLSSFPHDTMFQADKFTVTKKDEATGVETTSYVFLKAENLGEDGILFEKTDAGYVHSLDTEIAEDTSKYYVDILEQDDFSEDYTYGFRYLEDDEDPAQIAEAKAKWIEFYRFITKDLSTAEDIAQWKSEFSNWFIKDAALYYYIYTLRYTMVDNRAKNSFWHYGKHFITSAEVNAAAATLTAAQAELKTATEALAAIDKTTNADAYAAQELVVAEKQSIVDEAQAAVDRTKWFTEDDAAAAINDGYRFDFWDYDNDTALGIDNAGKLEMSYGIEDDDLDAAGKPYFRANDSLFFQRVLTYFASDLETAFNNYEATNAAVFSSESLINEFDEWQSQFPEELWRLDYERKYKRTYVNGSGAEWDNAIAKKADKRFLADMMNGKKKYQRRQFERNQDFYMSSKFIGTINKEDTITLRGAGKVSSAVVAPDYNLYITPYANMYINLHDGTKTYYHKRCYAGIEYQIPYSTDTLDFIYIRGGSKIQSLGDLSLMYLQTATLGTGEKLKDIKLGNDTEGYENKSLIELNITANNKLLQDLNVRNLPSLVGSLPITNIPSIKTLDARGTNYVSAVFANSGLVETAYLPASIQILTLNNLYFLKTLTLEDYSNVQQLLLADCPNFTGDLDLVNKCTSLRKVRVTDVDWTVTTTSLLNRLANCSGIGEDGTTEVQNSVLTGKVFVNGYIRQSEIDKYKEVWGAAVYQKDAVEETDSKLIITYANLMPQHNLIFKSVDVNTNAETVLYTELVDQGTKLSSSTHDPIKTGKINTPATQYSDDGQFAYIYKSWLTNDNQTIDEITISNSDVTFYAQYNQETRLYTVTWKDDNNDAAADAYIARVPWGTNAEFGGKLPSVKSDTGNNYSLFNGWDKTSTFITKDTVIYPTWVTSNPYTLGTKPTVEMTAEDIYGLKATKTISSYFTDGGEEITMQLGYMPEYDNITSQVLISQETNFDGATTYVDTDVELFNEDKGFTLVVDYEAGYRDKDISSYETLVSSYYQDKNGFKIVTQNNSIPQIWYKSSSTKTNVGHYAPGPSDSNYDSNIYTHREICVIRKVKGDNNLYVYTNDRWTTAAIGETKLASTSFSALENIKLCFGASRNSAGEHSDFFTGKIYYAKLWNGDIGADECKKVCSWIYDTLTFDFVGKQRYYYPDSDIRCQATFVANKLLDDMIYYNNKSNVSNEVIKQAYSASTIREWLNSKVLLGASLTWQQVITPVSIVSLEGSYEENNVNQINTTTHTTVDSFYIPSSAEVSSSSASDTHYNLELPPATAAFATFTDKASRQRKLFNIDEVRPYWLRTPYKSSSNYNMGVTTTGDVNYNDDNTNKVFYRSINYNRQRAGVLLCFSI